MNGNDMFTIFHKLIIVGDCRQWVGQGHQCNGAIWRQLNCENLQHSPLSPLSPLHRLSEPCHGCHAPRFDLFKADPTKRYEKHALNRLNQTLKIPEYQIGNVVPKTFILQAESLWYGGCARQDCHCICTSACRAYTSAVRAVVMCYLLLIIHAWPSSSKLLGYL